MTVFRPRFSEYKSPEQLAREEETRKSRLEHGRKVERTRKRQEAYGLVLANMSLLERHVEKSPVDINYFSQIKSFFGSGLVGGWPIGSLRVPGRGNSESYHGPTPGRIDYFVVTEDRRFGYARTDEVSNAFRLNDPVRLSERGFQNYNYFHSLGEKVGVPPVENIQKVLQELLAEAGVEPEST